MKGAIRGNEGEKNFYCSVSADHRSKGIVYGGRGCSIHGRKNQKRRSAADTYGIGSNLPSFSGIAGGDRDTMVQPDLGWNGADNNKIIFFAFYDYDVSTELQDMGMEGEGEHIELYFVPDGINADEEWRLVENAGLVFQTGIKDTRKLYANAYINETGTILYVEAIGGG